MSWPPQPRRALTSLTLLVDNQAVVRRLCRGLAGNVMGDCQGFWHEVLARWRPSNAIAWIPSHDKQQLWEPEGGFSAARKCRNANRFADEAATQALHEHQQNVTACVDSTAQPFWGSTCRTGALSAVTASATLPSLGPWSLLFAWFFGSARCSEGQSVQHTAVHSECQSFVLHVLALLLHVFCQCASEPS